MKRHIITGFLVVGLLVALSSAGFCGAAMVRGGDITAHGSPLPAGTGSQNVFIGGLPAWRAQVDMFCCPLLFQTTPHGCGYVITGSSSVLVNGYPAVYSGCTVMESMGGPNVIVGGCSTVQCGR